LKPYVFPCRLSTRPGTFSIFPLLLLRCAGVVAFARVMSKFVHPSKPIREQSANQAKNQKLEWGVLVEAGNKVI
jgi:hypothetical protein